MRKINYFKWILFLAGSFLMRESIAASSGVNINVNATIRAGTCYFNTASLTFDFGTVYPAAISSTDKALRPKSNDISVTAVKNNTSSDWTQRHTACDAGSTGMKFNIDPQGRSAMGADGVNILTLFASGGMAGNLATGFGISVYKVDGTTETPISVGADTNVGSPGNFQLRAKLVPLKDKSAADITGGYINAQAMLNISYQ